jgi:predicted AAA+ superfamily ATPase
MWIQRKNIERIKRAVQTRPAVLLTGIRQAGKSSILQKTLPEATYITLDKIEYAKEAEETPTPFLNKFDGQVIIDEVQYAPSLFRDLKVKIDENRQKKGKWILTGSQQFILMHQVSESLAGRIKILYLGTLSASELIASGLLKNRWDLLWKGGFPELWTEDLDIKEFYEDYIQTYLERDLRLLINVSDLRDFRRFLSLMAIRVGQLLNYSEIAKSIGVAANTVKAWVSTLETSGIVTLLPPYYNNLGKRLTKAPKVYFADNGLLCSLLNIYSENAFNNSLYLGSIWENFLLTEFQKEGYMAGKELFYYRDSNGVEIDFIWEHDGRTLLIEAKSAERPNPKKLNFKKVAPLFPQKVDNILACNIQEEGVFQFKEYAVFNPLNGIETLLKYNIDVK